ncbi:MAG: isoprenylcysteine carboxylmethyltransferase family protein [Ignavibacteriales bacterium]|nr:isoprenylcysteine carboxylmethyltransferase family protein [Ignavibacteriales bacterium]
MIVFAEPQPAAFFAGLVIMVVGEWLRFWGVAYAGALTRVTGNVGAPSLVAAGPFSYMRNPLYVGNITIYVGVGIMANALVPWLVIGAGFYFVIQYSLIVSLEEEFLQKEFGEEYGAYRAAVPRFIFRLSPFRSASAANQHPAWRDAVRSEKRTLQALGLVTLLIVTRWAVG